MKSLLLPVFILALNAPTFAADKKINIARCDSDCWVDRGDMSGVGRQCFIFYVSTDSAGNYFGEMLGGYDDAGNSNVYDLGPVSKTVSGSGMSWYTQKKSYVKSIKFTSLAPNSPCTIVDSNNKIYEGRSVTAR